MKKTALKSVLFILEWVLILIFHIYLRNHNLPDFINFKSSSIDVMSRVVYIVYVTPIFLLLRLLLQTINSLNKPLFILQNIYMLTVFLLSKVNGGDSLMKMYLFGAVLNLVFYYIDDFLVKLIDKTSNK